MCDGCKLRNQYGETVDSTQPVPVVTAEGLQLTSKSQTLTYNGKAAAGALTVVALDYHPVAGVSSGRVASYWGLQKNKVYEALADGDPQKGNEWLTSVVETNGSAVFNVYDPNRNLEEMFESVTGTVKRFIGKVIDKDGNSLYGWILGVSVSSNVYTFQVVNNRVTETQNWVGTLASFDNTALKKVEIYRYDSSIAFGTGTTLTEEVVCPREFSKSRKAQLEYAEHNLSNGQFFVDYVRGEIIGVKADTTASETVTYNILAPITGSSGGTSATDDSAFTPASGSVTPMGAFADETATDSVDEGDVGVVRMTLDRKLITAGNYKEDSAHSSTDYGNFVLAVANEAQSALAADGDYTAFAVDTKGNHLVTGNLAHDAADAGNPLKIGGKALTAQPTAVAANDRVNAMFDIYGRQIVMGSLREMKGSQLTTITSSTAETTVVTADATYKLDVYGVICTNTSATATEVTFKDATSGTSRFMVSVPANDSRGFMLPVDGAHVQAAANNNWTGTCADSVESVLITVLYVKNL